MNYYSIDFYLQIAHGNSWKMGALLPLTTMGQIIENLKTPELVLRAQKAVQNQELANYVENVENFYEQVQCGDIVA